MRTRFPLPAVALGCFLTALHPLTASAAGAAASPDPWSGLANLRHALAAQHLVASFSQTFLPAGFAQGEKESGALYLALPDCLRWEYRVPEAKSFLICGPDLYAWIPGEARGRHTVIEPRAEPGLDLLLLSIADLRERYEISPSGGDLELRPRDPQNAIRLAKFRLTGGGSRLASLEYSDAEGNVTRFDLQDWKPLAERTRFDPPPLQWDSE